MTRRVWPWLWLAASAPAGAADLAVTKSTAVVADGISTANPKAIPGATLDEVVLVVNPATNALVTVGGVTVTDTIPAAVKLRVRDLTAGGGPVEFADGGLLGLRLLDSGLSYRFASLANGGDSVDFSADGTDWSYVPVADADGCDARVRAIRVRPTGTQAAASGFRLRYRVVVR